MELALEILYRCPYCKTIFDTRQEAEDCLKLPIPPRLVDNNTSIRAQYSAIVIKGEIRLVKSKNKREHRWYYLIQWGSGTSWRGEKGILELIWRHNNTVSYSIEIKGDKTKINCLMEISPYIYKRSDIKPTSWLAILSLKLIDPSKTRKYIASKSSYSFITPPEVEQILFHLGDISDAKKGDMIEEIRTFLLEINNQELKAGRKPVYLGEIK